MERETLTAHAGTTPVARTTIEPYDEGRPGPFFYQRYAHRVGAEAERLLGELDGGQALLFPSGAGATAFADAGDAVAGSDGRGGRRRLLRHGRAVARRAGPLGPEVVGFDQTGPPPQADLVWLEPCSNPMLTFPDLDESIAAAHAAGARVAVDNTVLSPLLLRPLEHGADFVVHSATKILAGHHDALLGVVVCARDEDAERLLEWRGHAGIVAAPDPAWLLVRGLKTLGVRVPRQSATALELARRLPDHPAVATVRYPGLGRTRSRPATRTRSARSCRSTSPTRAAADRVERSLRLIENATSLGGTATTLEGRFRWEGDRVPPGPAAAQRRPGVVDDLWADLAQALDAAG